MFGWNANACIAYCDLNIAVDSFRGDGSGETPSTAVDQQEMDYGEMKFGVARTFAVKVTNTALALCEFKKSHTSFVGTWRRF